MPKVRGSLLATLNFLLLVAGCTLGGRTPPVAQTVLPTVTPQPSCMAEASGYLEQIQPHFRELSDTEELAGQTARIALAPVVQSLQRIKRDIEDIPAESCVESSRALLLRGIDSVIQAYLDFMGEAPDEIVSRELAQGYLDIANATEQLQALAAGRPTPQPERLPTPTPIPTLAPVPTPTPTPTPLPAGSTITVDSWEIKVTNILTTDSLMGVGGGVEKAEGRFAILFVTVTNKGYSPDTFVAFGKLIVHDATGYTFEENVLASAYAMFKYDTDIGADINPDASANVVAVFDISRSSSYYVLGPGILAVSSSGSVYLEIP